MQATSRVSLNALRSFAAAAEAQGFGPAAARLGVTPGAVSHQIRALEAALGTQLFRRRTNAVTLTEAGERLFRQSAPGLLILERALREVQAGASDISVQVPLTLAIRWLIPGLDRFRARHPGLRIRIETLTGSGLPPGPPADVALAYHPIGTVPDGAEVFLEDRCRPFLSPGLLARLPTPGDLATIPALQGTETNWDWQVWLAASGQPGTRLDIAGRFDLDDAAMRAAIAGLGMTLAPDFAVQDDVAAGRLVPLPGAPEVLLGLYTLHIPPGAPPQVHRFTDWLRRQRQPPLGQS